MKVLIYEDEWWPVFSITLDLDGWGKERGVPEELFQEYVRSLRDFNAVQEKLRKIYEAASPNSYWFGEE